MLDCVPPWEMLRKRLSIDSLKYSMIQVQNISEKRSSIRLHLTRCNTQKDRIKRSYSDDGVTSGQRSGDNA